jgi:glycine/D-amino acid oxidase-like deaminating enzyme
MEVAIMGGGFTSLWATIHLNAADRAVDVMELEARAVAYVANGRNGSFAMTMTGHRLHDLVRKVAPGRAKLTHLAMRESLSAIERFVAAIRAGRCPRARDPQGLPAAAAAEGAAGPVVPGWRRRPCEGVRYDQRG